MRLKPFSALTIFCIYAVAPAVLLLRDPVQAFAIRALVVLAVVFSGASERCERAPPTPSASSEVVPFISLIAAGVMLFATFIMASDAPHRREVVLVASIISATAMVIGMLVDAQTQKRNARRELLGSD